MINLRPGTYTVNFELPGFNRVQREGVQLTAAFTATVNAEMQVGGVEETITVSGSSPIVDVKGVAQQRTAKRGAHRLAARPPRTSVPWACSCPV